MTNSSGGGSSVDGLGAGLAFVAPVGAGVFVVGSVGVGIARWFADMYRGIAHIVTGSGTDSMEELERRIALADLVAIAALADARLDEAENDAMRALMTGNPAFEAELRDAFVRWQARGAVLANESQRASALRAAAAKLSEEQRAELRALVEAHGAPPAPPPPEGGNPYRVAAPEASKTMRDEILAALA
ncbi:MAG: hypothetical protein U0414_08760 [Polyangiaceae bacterium]